MALPAGQALIIGHPPITEEVMHEGEEEGAVGYMDGEEGEAKHGEAGRPGEIRAVLFAAIWTTGPRSVQITIHGATTSPLRSSGDHQRAHRHPQFPSSNFRWVKGVTNNRTPQGRPAINHKRLNQY